MNKPLLQESLGEDGDIWDYDDYPNIEMDSTFDGCWEEFIFFGNRFTEEEQEALEQEYEDQLEEGDWQSYEWLEERGFEPEGCNWQIHGGTDVEVRENKLEAYDDYKLEAAYVILCLNIKHILQRFLLILLDIV